MKMSGYLIQLVAILASIWLTWWLFDNIGQALGVVGIGLVLMLFLWMLEDIAEDMGLNRRLRSR